MKITALALLASAALTGSAMAQTVYVERDYAPGYAYSGSSFGVPGSGLAYGESTSRNPSKPESAYAPLYQRGDGSQAGGPAREIQPSGWPGPYSGEVVTGSIGGPDYVIVDEPY